MENKHSKADDDELFNIIEKNLCVYTSLKLAKENTPEYMPLFFLISDTSCDNRFNQIEKIVRDVLTESYERHKKQGYVFDFNVPMSKADEKFYELYGEITSVHKDKINIVYIRDKMIDDAEKQSLPCNSERAILSLWGNSIRIKI